jgi:hypothetical protein
MHKIIFIIVLILASTKANAQAKKSKAKKYKPTYNLIKKDTVKSNINTTIIDDAPPAPLPPVMTKPAALKELSAENLINDSQTYTDTFSKYNFSSFLKLDKEVYNFGNVQISPLSISANFTITNISAEPVSIINIKPSCSCTVPTFSTEAILPGASTSFTAIYNANGNLGSFNKSLTIFTTRGTSSVILMGTIISN